MLQMLIRTASSISTSSASSCATAAEGEHTEEELKKRFQQLDGDGSGKVDMAEYLQFSLRDALARSSDRVVDLFKKWDEDGSGKIDKVEFCRAIRSLGFGDVQESDIGAVFDLLDEDKSGHLEYKELNAMLRKGYGSQVQANLKRAKDVRSDSRAAKHTAKNYNENYQSAKLAALPPMVKLDASSGVSIADQLNSILAEHSVKLIDLFREWDEDGDGAISKKEFRMAVAALGYDAPKKDMNAAFDALDDTGDGYIEYGEFKAALSKHSKKGKGQPPPQPKKAASSASAAAEDGDVAGTGEEEFEVGMKQNAMERDAADADQDGKLDFNEFCQLVRDREEGEHTEEELKKRFQQLDGDGSGKVDMAEYLQFSLRDALARSSDRVVDLFKKWDEDGSGKIDKREFCHAVRALGFGDISEKDAGAVFDMLDDDKSGSLEYKELNAMLRKGFGSQVQANLKRAKDVRSDSRAAKMTRKNMNENYQSAKLAALPPMVTLDASSGVSIPDQINSILAEHSVKLIDLFREWDEDGDGAISKKEFRKAVAALGYDASKKDMNAAFDALDDTGDGYIEYGEFKAALSKHSKKGKGQPPPQPKKAASSASAAAEDGDVAGTGEEEFEVGMKQNAMERDAADADQDGKLDFNEFCQLVRDREEGEHTEEELKKRFQQLDGDGSGKVDMAEYLQFSLRDALARSSDRVVDLFKKWDEDGSGKIDKREFCHAVRALGFGDISEKDAGAVFDMLDDDKSGSLEYKELNAMLRKGFGSQVQANLKRAKDVRSDSRAAKMTRKNMNENYQSAKLAALPPMVTLDASSGVSIPDQINSILAEHSVKLIDLFREWDEDGDGAISKKEFRKAVAALGYDASKKDMNAAFDALDDTGDGYIEYGEFKAALSKHSKKGKGQPPPQPKKAASSARALQLKTATWLGLARKSSRSA